MIAIRPLMFTIELNASATVLYRAPDPSAADELRATDRQSLSITALLLVQSDSEGVLQGHAPEESSLIVASALLVSSSDETRSITGSS